MACFTRPELKVERVSYDVITPSAARAIFEAIFWKPAIRWEITRIEVLNPIKWTSIRRNEVGAVASATKPKPIFIETNRQQKNSLLLKDVRYRIHAKLIFCPVSNVKRYNWIYLIMKIAQFIVMRIQESIMPCLSDEPAKDNALISHILAPESFLHLSDWLLQKKKI